MPTESKKISTRNRFLQMINKCLEEKRHSIYVLCPECLEFVPLSDWRIRETTHTYYGVHHIVGRKDDRLFVDLGKATETRTENQYYLCHLIPVPGENRKVEHCINYRFFPQETPFCCIYIDIERKKLVVGKAAELVYSPKIIWSVKQAARKAGLLHDIVEVS